MESFQLVYDENDNQEIEILSDYGVGLLLQCFKEDYDVYSEHYSSKVGTKTPYWDCNNHSNWDYMLSGLNELKWYTDFMVDEANEINDADSETNFIIAGELIDELRETVTEILIYTAGNSTKLVHDLESFNFWGEMFFSALYIEQSINQTMLEMGA